MTQDLDMVLKVHRATRRYRLIEAGAGALQVTAAVVAATSFSGLAVPLGVVGFSLCAAGSAYRCVKHTKTMKAAEELEVLINAPHPDVDKINKCLSRVFNTPPPIDLSQVKIPPPHATAQRKCTP
jgi:hypothetical protein